VAATERRELIEAVFAALDTRGRRLLSARELRRLADHLDFRGTDADWAIEFQSLCEDNGATPEVGLDIGLFAQILNDRSEKGFHCTDSELRAFLGGTSVDSSSSRSKAASPRERRPDERSTRPDLIRLAFEGFDARRRGTLDVVAMQRFAWATGFTGDDAAWAEDYAALCDEHGADPEVGITLKMFADLVNDDSGNGCFCTDGELRSMTVGAGATPSG